MKTPAKKIKDDLTIKVKITTADKLKALGRMGDSYDDVINLLIDEHEEKSIK